MLNVQTINCMQYSEPAVMQSRSQSRNETNTHKENLVQKHPGGGGTPIHYLYGYVPPKGVVILKLLI